MLGGVDFLRFPAGADPRRLEWRTFRACFHLRTPDEDSGRLQARR